MDTRLVERALDKTAEALTPVVRNHALEQGWPADVARSLTLHHEAGGLHVTATDKVMDAEFGAPNRRPKAALAAFFQGQAGVRRQRQEALAQMGDIVTEIDRLFR